MQKNSTQTLNTTPSFLDNIHTLRACTIFFIVAGHSFWLLPWAQPQHLQQLVNLFENGSVMFVFVAGFLFQHLHKRFAYLDYLIKKVSHVVLPYLLISTPAIWVALHHNHYPQLEAHSIGYQIGWYLLKGGAHLNFPLWFVPMICLFYLAAPVFMWIIRHPKLYWLIPPLCVLSLVIKRAPFPNLDTPHLALYMLPAYLLGMWCSQFRQNSVLVILEKNLLVTLALIICCFLLPYLADRHTSNYEESGYFTFEAGWIDWLFAQKLLLVVLLAAAFKHLPSRMHQYLAPIAATSFSIFFLHAYWIHLLVKLLGENRLPSSLMIWLCSSLLVLLLSHATALLTKKLLPKHSRYLIGY